MQKPTDWLTILCVATMTLGVFGMCCDLTAVGALAMGDRLGQGNPMQAAMYQAQLPFRPLLFGLTALQFAHSVVLTLGAGLAMRSRERHPRLFRFALEMGIVLVPLALVASLYVQWSQMRAMAIDQPMAKLIQGAALFGLAWAVLLSGGKVAFFVFTHRYLRRTQAALANP